MDRRSFLKKAGLVGTGGDAPSNVSAEADLEPEALEGDAPRRCKTGAGDPQNMECFYCGAALGEICRKHSTDI